MLNRNVWTPEQAIIEVPACGIKYPRLFVRTGDFGNEKIFTEVLTAHLPHTPKPNFADGESFVNFLGNQALNPDGIVLAVIEATVVIKAFTCIRALEDGLKIANKAPGLKKQVIPVVVVGDMAHTRYYNAQTQNPDGPRQVVQRSKALGAIPVSITSGNLRERITQVIGEILRGQMPAAPSF